MKKNKPLFIAVLFLFFLSFLNIGGCDVDFGTPDDSGNGSNNGESVEGKVISVIPSREKGVENITVKIISEITQEEFTDITNSSGFFKIEGSFAGNAKIEFIDEENEEQSLGKAIINVFPTAELKLGDISLEDGNIVFEDDTTVTFDAVITQNDCTVNNGTLTVEALNDDHTVEIVVQVDNATDIKRDEDDITCDDLIDGDDVEIEGTLLLGNSVKAHSIEVL